MSAEVKKISKISSKPKGNPFKLNSTHVTPSDLRAFLHDLLHLVVDWACRALYNIIRPLDYQY